MKKQFNRMRQLANQTVGRAEKTEVLSDDLLQIERRMELVRLVSHNAHKRLVSCLQGQVGTDSEKRHKKLPLMALCQTMQDGGAQLGDESLIGKMMEVCGQAETTLASELMEHELQIERDILDPLYQLAEVDIPNILKQRKQLSKLVLDYDSARSRWYQATKSSNQAMAAKLDSLKDEMEEAHNRVEICKDQLSADMYNFASKDSDYARYYLTLLESQADYHRKSLAALETAIPNIQLQQDTWMEKPAYGTSLEEHLKRSGRDIALPLEACVMMLLESGMKEEGLFRIAAGASKLKKLKAALDCSTSTLSEFYSDPHAVAGALKSYLRELPEPLMTFSLYDEWIQASNVSDPDKRLQALWVVCDGLPKNHKANFRYLVKFLSKLSQDSDINKMTPSNIAIVLGPNLLWAKTEGTLAEMAAATSIHSVTIIEPIITHADWFFPEEVEFNVSDMFGPETPDSSAETPGLDRRRPGSQDSSGGDAAAHTPTTTPRKDSIVNKHPEPAPRRTGTVIRKQPQQLNSPTFLQPPSSSSSLVAPSLEAPPPTDPQPQHQPLSLQRGTEAEQPGLRAGGGGVSVGGQSGGGGSGGGLQVATVPPLLQPLNHLISEEGSPARELTSTPPPQRNGSVYLTAGTPHSQGGSRGPSPHLMRRGTKKQAPAPPKQASPFSNQTPPTGGSPHPQHQHPAAAPRRHAGKDSPIHAPAHPPPQPPPPAAAPHHHHHQGESESSPPSSTPSPTPPDTDTPPQQHGDAQTTPHHQSSSSSLLPQNPYPTGSLPRPSRPAPKPRPRPNMAPPPQPPPTNDDGDDDDGGFLGSASKIITDGGLFFTKGIGRAFVPVIAVDQPGESSAGHEPAPHSSSLNPPTEAEIQSESTLM